MLKKHSWLLLSMLKTVVLLNIFVETIMQKKSIHLKQKYFVVKAFFCFYQFNVSLLNKM